MNDSKVMWVMILFAVIVIALQKIAKPTDRNVVDTDIQIVKSNDSLKLEINNLDSIKDAKVIEVQKLDNDSTIKLFYELIE